MKRNLILSIAVLLLALSLIGGATTAWFNAGAELEPNVFTTGTVKIAIDEGEPPAPRTVLLTSCAGPRLRSPAVRR